MAVKRKISIRKILQVFLTLVVTTCCIIAMVGASRIEENKVLKDVAIHFRNDKKYHFIQEQEIRDLNKIFDTDMNEFIGYYGARFSQLCSERERRRK